MDIPDDVWKYIFSFVKFTTNCLDRAEIKHKELCLVSKQWQMILDDMPYAFHVASVDASINFLRKNIKEYKWKAIFEDRKLSEKFRKEFNPY